MRRKSLKRERSIVKLCQVLTVVFLLALSANFVLAVEGKIAFMSQRGDDEDWTISIMHSDGAGRFELTEGTKPTWLPDGRTIGFVHRDDVWTIDSDGTNLARITKSRPDDGIASAAWSPNGRKIAYYGRLGAVWDIFVMDADGKNPKNLTRDPRYHGTPSWSPYGNRITFMTLTLVNIQLVVKTDTDIMVMGANGGEIMNVTNRPLAKNSDPSWSPNGKKIAYSASPKPGLWLPPRNIHLINVDGTDPAALTPQDRWAYEWNPTWSPDSNMLAFRKQSPDGWTDIYIINADGSNLRNITQTHGVSEASPSWSPAPLAVSSSGRLVTQWGDLKRGAKPIQRIESED